MKALKTFLLTVAILLANAIVPSVIWAEEDDVPIEGEWTGPKGIKSLVPAPPTVSIDGNTVSIHFRAALTDLTVYIVQGTTVVYQTVISANGYGDTQELPWAGEPGTYQIQVTHYYGYLWGNFTIE